MSQKLRTRINAAQKLRIVRKSANDAGYRFGRFGFYE